MKQTVVDRYVDDLAYTFGVDRDSLNVVSRPRLKTTTYSKMTVLPQVAAAKGLTVGSFTMTRKDQSVIDFTAEPEVSNDTVPCLQLN